MKQWIIAVGIFSLFFVTSTYANAGLIFGGNIVFPDGSVQGSTQVTLGSICNAINAANQTLPSFCYSYQPPTVNVNDKLVFGGNIIFPDGSVQGTSQLSLGSICNVIYTSNLTLPSFCSTYQTPSLNTNSGLISLEDIVFPDESVQTSAAQLSLASICNAINEANQTLPTFCTSSPAPTLISIAVTPAKTNAAAGSSQQFTATGTYSDNSTQNLSVSVNWNSSNTSVATIQTGGMAFALTEGSTTITASSGAIAGSTTFSTAPNPNPFTTSMLSGNTYTVNSSNGSTGALTFNSNGTISGASQSGPIPNITWSVNNSGQLIFTYTSGSNIGEVDTITPTSITSTGFSTSTSWINTITSGSGQLISTYTLASPYTTTGINGNIYFAVKNINGYLYGNTVTFNSNGTYTGTGSGSANGSLSGKWVINSSGQLVETDTSGTGRVYTFTQTNVTSTGSTSLYTWTSTISPTDTGYGTNATTLVNSGPSSSPLVYTSEMISGLSSLSCNYSNSSTQITAITRYSNGTLSGVSTSETTSSVLSGTWVINSSGQLVQTYPSGRVVTYTLTSLTPTARTYSFSWNNTITPSDTGNGTGTAIPAATYTGAMLTGTVNSYSSIINSVLYSGSKTYTGNAYFGTRNGVIISGTWTVNSSGQLVENDSTGRIYIYTLANVPSTTYSYAFSWTNPSSPTDTGCGVGTTTGTSENSLVSDLQTGVYSIQSNNYIPPGGSGYVNVYYYKNNFDSGNTISNVNTYFTPYSGTWITSTPTGYTPSPCYILNASGWVQSPDNMTGASITSNSDGSVTLTSPIDGSQANVLVVSSNIANRTIASAYPKYRNWPILNNGSATFPPGSALFNTSMTYLSDNYTLWSSYAPLTILSNAPSLFQQVNIDAQSSTISYYCTFGSTGNSATIYQNNNGVISSIGTTTWAINTLNGQQLLEISIPAGLRTLYQLGGNPVISIINGYAWVGEHALPNVIEYGYSGSSINGVALDFIISQFNTALAE